MKPSLTVGLVPRIATRLLAIQLPVTQLAVLIFKGAKGVSCRSVLRLVLTRSPLTKYHALNQQRRNES
jgi:hypothetical protein